MNDKDLEKLKEIGSSLRRLNGKVKLIGLLERAKFEYEQNKLNDCEETCREILKTEPENPIALRGLGCVFQSKNDNKNALKYYEKALEFSENKEIEYTLIGTVYYNQDDLEKAIEYYNRAIDINDDYDLAYEGKNQSMLERHLQILDLQDNLIRRNLFK